jgi:microsomal dipeptidase-like Zn-dependent dipeptidase
MAVLAMAIGPSTPGAQAQTRYSVAGGCFTLASAASGQPVPGGSSLRFQATELGSYLLFRQAGDFLAAGADDSVGPAAQPSPAADWTVEDASGGAFTLSPKSAPARVLAVADGKLVLVARDGAGEAARFTFSSAAGCAAFPEAELNVSGTPSRGETSYGEVTGLLDGHMHWMTFEYLGGNFHCGRPWHRYGIPAALPDCSSVEGPAGAAAPMQNFLNYGSPVAPHDTSGWPKLTAWSRTNLTYEGIYYRWMERVWKSGLRLIVMPVNENRVLCELQTNRRNSCDEMTTVRKGIEDIEELQDYVDAQAGGPGKGFFEIVRDPFDARRVINEGKLAVVLEVEISELFGCRGYDNPTCSQAQIDAQLDDLYNRGVRSSLLLNKFDNSLAGVRFDSGEIGLLINAGNKESSGSFWSAETCPGPERDNTIYTGVPEASGFLASLMTALGAPPGTAPAYPPPPHCNTRGLSQLGDHTVREMMRRGMIINPDHMSQRGVDATLRLAEERRYSGVISPHSWMDPRNWPRIWALGGMAFPSAGSASGFVEDWRNQRPAQTPYYFGWGWGADLGGLATQGAPVPPDSPARVTYPFKSLDGAVTIDRQRSGERVFDYANEGVAHYGLYADWAEEVRKLGGPGIVSDLLRGPEAYLQMWERAVGIPAKCVSRRGRFGRRGLGAIRLGMTPRALLESAGQPLRRTRTWSYCVQGKGRAGTAAVMTPEGKVALIASTAPGHRARGIRPGDRLAKLRGRAKRIGGGVWISRLGKTRVAYLVRRKRVRTVAIAGPEARSRKTLREHLGMVTRVGTGARPAFAARRTTEPVTPENAAPLVQKHDPAKHALFCDLGL